MGPPFSSLSASQRLPPLDQHHSSKSFCSTVASGQHWQSPLPTREFLLITTKAGRMTSKQNPVQRKAALPDVPMSLHTERYEEEYLEKRRILRRRPLPPKG